MAHRYPFLHENALTLKGGGFWQPDASTLAKLRRDIDRKPHKIKAVLTDSGIREAFLGGVKDDEKKAVKAFTSLSMNQSNALKRNPKVCSICLIHPLRQQGISRQISCHQA